LAIYEQVFGIGAKPAGFRAPSHLIDKEAMFLLEQSGFLYDSSIVPHYPFFKKYRGFQGKAPKIPYYPDSADPRAPRKSTDPRALEILEIPVAGQIFGLPLAGAWISRLSFLFWKLLFVFSKPKFITVSMHPWDILDFAGRTTSPQDFLNNLEKILLLLKKKNYQFLFGKEIREKYGNL